MANGLGRGLGSLIPQKNNSSFIPDVMTPGDSQITKIDPNLIQVNPRQPRQIFATGELDELVQSIREHGIIQPLIITKTPTGYELIAGERRWRSAKQLGLKEVPVIVRAANEQTKLELALIENIQRADLNAVEQARAYKQLVEEFNLSQEQVAQKIGKSRSAIANTLRILQLPELIQQALSSGEISEGHAKILMGLDSEQKQFELFNRVRKRKLTVDDTLLEARRMGGTKQARVLINHTDKDKEMRLRQFFGAKANIKRVRAGGQIIIHFTSEEELGEIMKKVK